MADPTRCRRVAVYGGTFDPVTRAHMLLVREILELGAADAVHRALRRGATHSGPRRPPRPKGPLTTANLPVSGAHCAVWRSRGQGDDDRHRPPVSFPLRPRPPVAHRATAGLRC